MRLRGVHRVLTSPRPVYSSLVVKGDPNKRVEDPCGGARELLGSEGRRGEDGTLEKGSRVIRKPCYYSMSIFNFPSLCSNYFCFLRALTAVNIQVGRFDSLQLAGLGGVCPSVLCFRLQQTQSAVLALVEDVGSLCFNVDECEEAVTQEFHLYRCILHGHGAHGEGFAPDNLRRACLR